MRLFFAFFLAAALPSCFFFRDYRKKTFAYTHNGQAQRVAFVVPKGFRSETVADTAGVRLHTFQYPDGAVLYAAYLTDTTLELQSFDKPVHQPLPHPAGGRVFKQQNGDERFYREIRQGHLRFGYKNVDYVAEPLFDSATNAAAWRR